MGQSPVLGYNRACRDAGARCNSPALRTPAATCLSAFRAALSVVRPDPTKGKIMVRRKQTTCADNDLDQQLAARIRLLRNTANKIVTWCDKVEAGRKQSAKLDLPPADDPPQDGPIEPNAFAWKGKVGYGLSRVPFFLVRHLWQKKSQTATFDELTQAVWGKTNQYAIPSDAAVRGVQRRVNRFFESHSFPWRITLRCNRFVDDLGLPQYSVTLTRTNAADHHD
jgi:hypothetical protein